MIIEPLFWKVIHNKYLFNYILSSIGKDEFPNSIPYEYIISVSSMLDMDEIELLKYKVKRNDYITFSNLNSIPNSNSLEKNNCTWIKLFSKFGNNEENKEFYKDLFKNYSNQLPTNVFHKLIESNCMVGLKVFIETFQYEPTIENLISSINLKSFKCTVYLTELLSTLLPLPLSISNMPYKIDVETSSVKELIKWVNHICSIYKPTKQFIQSNQDYFFSIFKKCPLGHSFRLKDLIKFIDLLNLLDSWELIENSNFKYPIIFTPKNQQQHQQTKHKQDINLIGKDKVLSTKFTNDRLKSQLNYSINYSSDQNEIIKSLLDFYYKVGNGSGEYLDNKHEFVEFYICYDKDRYGFSDLLNYGATSHTHELNIQKVLQLSFEHAHFPLFSNYYRSSIGQSNITPMISTMSLFYFDKSNTILFKKCKNQLEKQIQFIDLMVQEYIIPTNNYPSIIESSEGSDINMIKKTFKFPSIFLFYVLVNNDNVELLKRYVEKVGGREIIYETPASLLILRGSHINFLGNSISEYIKSIEMMDYIFKNFFKLVQSNNLLSINDPTTINFVPCQISELELVKHFEKLYVGIQNKDPRALKNPFKKITLKNPNFKVSFIEYALSKLSIYSVDSIIYEKPIDIDIGNNKSIYTTSIKNAILSNGPNSFKCNAALFNGDLVINASKYKQYPPKYLLEFFNWLLNNNCNSNSVTFIDKFFSCSSKGSFQIKTNSFKLLQYCIIGYNPNQGNIQLFQETTTISSLPKHPINPSEIVYDFGEVVMFSIKRGDLITLNEIIIILTKELNTPIKFIDISSFQYKQSLELKEKIKIFLNEKILKFTILEEQYLVLIYLISNHGFLFKNDFIQNLLNVATGINNLKIIEILKNIK